MKSLTTFGTYGFLSTLIAAQMAMTTPTFGNDTTDKIDRAAVDAKKSARSVRRDIKKNARKATGQDNAWDDVKDKASDAKSNLEDEANHQKRKHTN